MIELFGWLATVCALAGCVLNNRKMIACFWLWIVSNIICAYLHAHVGLWPLFCRDIGFLGLAVEGFFKWRKQKEKTK